MRPLMLSLLPLLLVGLSACGRDLPNLPDDPALQNSTSGSDADGSDKTPPVEVANPAPTSPGTVDAILQKYQYVDPNHLINTKVLKDALLAFDANKSKFTNINYITVVDFSLRSNLHRFFVIDMKTGAVTGYPVAHGLKSDGNPGGSSNGYAVHFSNTMGSNMSSLGVFRAAETYSGKHGYSMRIDGLSSTNSNVRARAVVVHGADYVQDANVIQGRSDGCFALPMGERVAVINEIHGGSMIYAGLEN